MVENVKFEVVDFFLNLSLAGSGAVLIKLLKYVSFFVFFTDEALIADRLVISVMICDDGMDYFALRDHPYLLGLI